MLVHNPRASRATYPRDLQRILSIAAADESRLWLRPWHLLRPDATPLWALPGLAARLGIAGLAVKDESVRSPLGSFKALGAPYALARFLQQRWREHRLDPATLWSGDYRDRTAETTVISATDGNHGRALAAAAQSIGCGCVIVLHAEVSVEREQAIAAYNAQIVRIRGNYDAAVAEAARLAAHNGWQVVSDTSYTGYEAIPRDVMQGYAIIAAEVIEQTDSPRERPAFSHVLLQGGVGGLAAGVASYLWEWHGRARPQLLVVEPHQADCLLQSALRGAPAHATGTVDSVMAGLACGAASPLAWRILEQCIDHFVTVGDDDAIDAMQLLAAGSGQEPPIVAGESGAAGLAGLLVLLADAQLAPSVGLDQNARVLVINTEGATAPQVYRDLVGEPASHVLRRQAAWLTG